MCSSYFRLFAVVLASMVIRASSTAAQTKPNFLIIVSDDQPDGTIGAYMPVTQSRIFDQGAAFTKAYVTTPACCPSRSSMLTGNYASRHGVLTNNNLLRSKTVIQSLHDAGYLTGHVGKFLNTWDGSKRPGYDFWVAFEGGGTRYENARLNVQGKWHKYKDYLTDVLTDYAVEFLDQAAASPKPFVLWFAPNAPHDPFTPSADAAGLWANSEPYRPPSFNDSVKAGKPLWMRRRKPMTAQEISDLDLKRERQLEMIWSLDQGIARVLSKLEEQQRLDSTVIIFISDNGLFWGEFGLMASKDAVYEPVIKVPCALRYPPLVPEPRLVESLVANMDIAATVYDLSGVTPVGAMDGVSMGALLRNEIAPRSHIFIESFLLSNARSPFAAIHTGRYKYVMNFGDTSEFYDLEQDPYEMSNRIGEAESSALQGELRQALTQHLDNYWTSRKLKKLRSEPARGQRKRGDRARDGKAHNAAD